MLSLFVTLFLVGAMVALDIRVPKATLLKRLARYLFVSILNHDLYLIVQLNMNLVRTNVEPFQLSSYIGIMMFRYLLLPYVFVVGVDLFCDARNWLHKSFVFTGTVAALTSLEFLSEKLGMITLLNWNYFYSSLLIALTLVAALDFERYFKWLLRREGAPV